MPLVVPVKFTYASRDLWFDPQDLDILEADYAICSTERGTEIGLVTADPFEVPQDEIGQPLKPGSMGKPIPGYGIDLVNQDGTPTADGDTGEIVIHTAGREHFCGLFLGYYQDKERTEAVWHDGLYHTGDLAWRDEDGFYWYVGRADDVIKSSGYRIGPFEIENVIMELPYVLECGVAAAPDEVRGQVVKASIGRVKGTEGTEELKKEIQNYVKQHTAPYKYPRIVEFKEELPKTISGKIIRSKL